MRVTATSLLAAAVPLALRAAGAGSIALFLASAVALIPLCGAYLVVSRRRLRTAADDPAAGRRSAAWPVRRSIGLLSVAILLGVAVAETLVGSLEVFARNAGLSGFFVAAIVVALVGNAVEHSAAVVLARRGRIDLAAEIAISSGAQVAALLIPVAVLAAWVVGPRPLTLGPAELAAVGAPAAVVAVLLSRGSSRRRGLALIGTYSAFALVALLAGG